MGDIIIAEPKALIGFSGPRVIEQTFAKLYLKVFNAVNFYLEHGAIDCIIDRRNLRNEITDMIAKLMHRTGVGEKLEVRNQKSGVKKQKSEIRL